MALDSLDQYLETVKESKLTINAKKYRYHCHSQLSVTIEK